jgi:hypothetical protein
MAILILKLYPTETSLEKPMDKIILRQETHMQFIVACKARSAANGLRSCRVVFRNLDKK